MIHRWSPRRVRTATAAVLLLTLAAPPQASAQVGPEDLEETRRTLAEDVLPVVGGVYESTACHYVGGSIVFHPPGLGDTGLVGCGDPWCHPWLVVSLMCFQLERLTDPDPRYSGICVVYQTVTPETVEIPYQDAVGPLEMRCIDPLMHNSVYGGFCSFLVQVFCVQNEPLHSCVVYSTAVGCSNVGTGRCVQAVQTFCLGRYYPADGTDSFPAVCILWVEALRMCVTVSDGSMPEQ